MLSSDTQKPTLKLIFLVLPGFSLLSLGTFIERLTDTRSAPESKRVSNISRTLLTMGGESVTSSCGVCVESNGSAFSQSITPDTCNYFVIFGEKGSDQNCNISKNIDSLIIKALNDNIQVIYIDHALFHLHGMGSSKNTSSLSSRTTSEPMEAFLPFSGTVNNNLIISENIWYGIGSDAAAAASRQILQRRDKYMEYIDSHINEKILKLPKNSRYQEKNSLIRPELSLVLAFLISNLSTDSDLGLLIQHTGLSKGRIEQLLLRETGRTLRQTISDLRITTAYALMKDEKKSLQEIAGECGFDSVAQFSRFFKSKTNSTPGQWQYSHFTSERNRTYNP